jgi:predicted transcriptional regulator
MASLQIPEPLESGLAASAARRGSTTEQVIEELLTAHVEEEFAAPETFSDAQLARFKQSIAQLDRGEIVTDEEVEAKFEAFFKRHTAR